MEFFFKYKIEILRVVGVLFLLSGFVIHFWVVPQPVATQNDLAAANLARMEASVSSTSVSSSKKASKESSFLKEFKEKQKQQLQYVTIFVMLLGAAALGGSFLKKKE